MLSPDTFWAGRFGDDYSSRNSGAGLEASNIALFRRILETLRYNIDSVIEFGCNIGLNLKALKEIDPCLELAAVEINERAAQQARDLGLGPVMVDDITRNLSIGLRFDLAFTKGVLIHIAPADLPRVYLNLYDASTRYVLLCEYYNPTPVMVPYRGKRNRLWKRDFAGEMIDMFGMKLVDYGFAYRRDNESPQDDLTWFLLEK